VEVLVTGASGFSRRAPRAAPHRKSGCKGRRARPAFDANLAHSSPCVVHLRGARSRNDSLALAWREGVELVFHAAALSTEPGLLGALSIDERDVL